MAIVPAYLCKHPEVPAQVLAGAYSKTIFMATITLSGINNRGGRILCNSFLITSHFAVVQESQDTNGSLMP